MQMDIPDVVKIRMQCTFSERVMNYYYGFPSMIFEDIDLPPLDERVETISDMVIHENQVAKAQKEVELKQGKEVVAKSKVQEEPQGPSNN
jgi:hypothetical protein